MVGLAISNYFAVVVYFAGLRSKARNAEQQVVSPLLLEPVYSLWQYLGATPISEGGETCLAWKCRPPLCVKRPSRGPQAHFIYGETRS